MKFIEKLNTKQKRELVLIIVILVIAGAVSIFYYMKGREPAEMVVVSVDGNTTATLSLHENTDMVIAGIGGTNRLIIKDGFASITEATCPDRVCQRTGKISKSGELIVCLPNRVVVTVEGE